MPHVPDGPSVRLNPIATPFDPGRGATSGAFGGPEAQSLINAGEAGQQIGDALIKSAERIQRQDNERELLKLDTEWSATLREIGYGEGGFFGTRGDGTLATHVPTVQAIDKARQKMLASVKNDAVREQFDALSATRAEDEFDVMARHVLTQRRVADDAVSEARLSEAADDAAVAFNDPERVDRSLAVARDEIFGLAQRNGWSEEVAQSKIEEVQTTILKSVIEAASAVDPIAARKLFADRNELIDGRVQADIERAIQRDEKTARVAEEKAVEENRAFAFAKYFDGIIECTVSEDDIDAARSSRLISGEQFVTLRRALDAEETPEDDDGVVLVMMRDLDDGLLTKERVLNAYGDGLITRERAVELRTAVDRGTDETEREALQFIRANVGGVRGPLAVLDSQSSQREAAAVREFRSRVDKGESPDAVADDIVTRFRKQEPGMSALPRPVFLIGPRSNPDIAATAQRTLAAFDRGEISEATLKRELENLERIEEILSRRNPNKRAPQ